MLNNGTAMLTNCTFSGNDARWRQVGGLGNNGTATLTNCTFSGNAGSNGGGLQNNGTATLTNCTFSDNNSGANGGGALQNNGTATLTNCTVSGNSGDDGLNNGGTAMLTMTNCTVSGNYGNQGALSNVGTATLTNCTVSGNRSRVLVGGLFNSGTATLTNCTVSGNSAQFGGGGGVINSGTTLTLTNTIVAGNGGSEDIVGGYSGSNNLVGGNPLLAPLGDNGGPTQTMALLPGSPAIGTGDPAQAGMTDQRGYVRGNSVDIGAVNCQLLIVTSTADDNRAGTLRSKIVQANSDGGGDTIAFSSLFNTPQTITLSGSQLELSGTRAPTMITGPGANLLSVSGGNSSRVFQVDHGVTASILGLTITGGKTQLDGAGLYNSGVATLTNCTVSGNSAQGGGSGGGVFNVGAATLTLTNCTVSGNSAQDSGGGGLFNVGTAMLTNSTVVSAATPGQRRKAQAACTTQRGGHADHDQLHGQRQLGRQLRRSGQQRHSHADRLHRQRQLGPKQRRWRPVQRRLGDADQFHRQRQLGSRRRRRRVQLRDGHVDHDQLHAQRQLGPSRRRPGQREVRYGHSGQLHHQRQLGPGPVPGRRRRPVQRGHGHTDQLHHQRQLRRPHRRQVW